MKFNSGGSQSDDLGQLIAPITNFSKSCLVFFIHAKQDFIGDISLLIKENPKIMLTKKLHNIKIKSDSAWGEYKLPIPEGYYQIVFQAMVKFPFKSDLAIDDVEVKHIDACGNVNLNFTFEDREGKILQIYFLTKSILI